MPAPSSLSLPPPSATLQGLTHRLLERLQAVHAHSVPGPIAGSADGSGLFVADFGGSLQAWDVTSLLDEPDRRVLAPGDADRADFLRAEWLPPLSVSDDIGNDVWSTALDPTTFVDAAGERNELYVCVMVGRYGILVLRFLPAQPEGQGLQPVRRIEIPYGQGSLFTRRSSDPSVRTLLVADSLAGPRAFECGDRAREIAMRGNRICARPLAFVLWSACIAIPARCQEQLAHLDGNPSNGLAPCAKLGDIDGDGVDDFVSGLPFGWAVSGAGDLDGDGVPDGVVGEELYGNSTHQAPCRSSAAPAVRNWR